MKKIFILWMFCILAVGVGATTLQEKSNLFRARMDQALLVKPINSGDDFLKAARQGDVIAISHMSDKTFLLATDAYGNNCFHLAKDAATINALAAAIRRLEEEKAPGIIKLLRNQRNYMRETPAMYHINSAKPSTFRLLFKGSDLDLAIEKIKPNLNVSGALTLAVSVEQRSIREESRDKSGRTIAQAAQANQAVPGMSAVVRYFETTAPYLF